MLINKLNPTALSVFKSWLLSKRQVSGEFKLSKFLVRTVKHSWCFFSSVGVLG